MTCSTTRVIIHQRISRHWLVPRLDDVSILIDTSHVPMEQRALTVDDTAFESVLERAESQLRD